MSGAVNQCAGCQAGWPLDERGNHVTQYPKGGIEVVGCTKIRYVHPSEHVACTCQACKFGLWCADGQRGKFERGKDACELCGVLAWKHSSKAPKGACT